MLVPPTFVSVSVELWVEMLRMEEAFEIQSQFQTWMDEYLNPYASQDWEIGRMPTEAQIRLLLRSGRQHMVIRHISIYTVYQDETGSHEQMLEELKVSPYMMCRSGNHRIHIIQK